MKSDRSASDFVESAIVDQSENRLNGFELIATSDVFNVVVLTVGLFLDSPSKYGTDDVDSMLRFDDQVFSGFVILPEESTNFTVTTPSRCPGRLPKNFVPLSNVW